MRNKTHKRIKKHKNKTKKHKKFRNIPNRNPHYINEISQIIL